MLKFCSLLVDVAIVCLRRVIKEVLSLGIASVD